MVLGCIVYVVFPIDLIPDLLIGPGQLDDLGVIVLTIRSLLGGGKPN